MNVNLYDLNEVGRKLSLLSDIGYLLMCLGIDRHGYYIIFRYYGQISVYWDLDC